MKKFGFRILVGLIAFAIGFGAVIIWIFPEKQPASEKGNLENVEALVENSKRSEVVSNHRKSGKVEIDFIGFKKEGNSTIAEIEIINNSPKTFYFWSVSKDSIATHVEFNGVKSKPIAVCGNVAEASKDYPLLSGETMKTTMQLDRMGEFVPLKKENEFRVGYYFSLGKNKDSQIFWSEKLQLPEWAQDELKKYYAKPQTIEFK